MRKRICGIALAVVFLVTLLSANGAFADLVWPDVGDGPQFDATRTGGGFEYSDGGIYLDESDSPSVVLAAVGGTQTMSAFASGPGDSSSPRLRWRKDLIRLRVRDTNTIDSGIDGSYFWVQFGETQANATSFTYQHGRSADDPDVTPPDPDPDNTGGYPTIRLMISDVSGGKTDWYISEAFLAAKTWEPQTVPFSSLQWAKLPAGPALDKLNERPIQPGGEQSLGDVSTLTYGPLPSPVDVDAAGEYIESINTGSDKEPRAALIKISGGGGAEGEGEGEGEGASTTEGTPVAGIMGLGLVAAVCALGGALALKKS